MEGALQFLNVLFSYLWQFVPQTKHITWKHRGIRYRGKKPPVLLDPGVWWYWPWRTQIVLVNIRNRAEEFKSQSYLTRDGKTFELGYSMVYYVADPLKAESDWDDWESSLAELAESILSPIVNSHTYDQVLALMAKNPRRGSVDAQLTSKAKILGQKFGIIVDYCRINTSASARAIKLFNEES